MCGIFGLISAPHSTLSPSAAHSLVCSLFRYSESRGKEAAGAAALHGDEINVIKAATSASSLLTKPEMRCFLRQATRLSAAGSARCIIGHSRLVTNGSQAFGFNNQPVVAGGMVVVHNGIVTNDAQLWAKFPDLTRSYEVDTEVIAALLRRFTAREGDLRAGTRAAFSLLEGAASVAVIPEDYDGVLLATNNGSLYYTVLPFANSFLFASEEAILRKLSGELRFYAKGSTTEFHQLLPNQGAYLPFDNASPKLFNLKALDQTSAPGNLQTPRKLSVVDLNALEPSTPASMSRTKESQRAQEFERHLQKCTDAIRALIRCKRCLLPETMPYLGLDSDGVCAFCRAHRPLQRKDPKALHSEIRKRDATARYDCLVALSGGRDSSYALHLVCSELKLRPIAYTYDWGMVTDLARRNISRLCGHLGVEHILVSADIAQKRRNIRSNLNAWLRRPDLGLVPLFMAGDKQFFYHASRLQQELRLPLALLSENPFERTTFKSGFCGIRPSLGERSVYRISGASKIKLAQYYLRSFILNPGFLNRSLFDTTSAFVSYYMLPHRFASIYDYFPWNEDRINEVLVREYNWEIASDTESTWRIGDGTASFYNYIYYVMAGFTENDTFRANQIREGVLRKEDAEFLVKRDNAPRWDSIRWYLSTIGVDFDTAISAVNSAPKLYRVE